MTDVMERNSPGSAIVKFSALCETRNAIVSTRSGPYPEALESNPHLHILFFKLQFPFIYVCNCVCHTRAIPYHHHHHHHHRCDDIWWASQVTKVQFPHALFFFPALSWVPALPLAPFSAASVGVM